MDGHTMSHIFKLIFYPPINSFPKTWDREVFDGIKGIASEYKLLQVKYYYLFIILAYSMLKKWV